MFADNVLMRDKCNRLFAYCKGGNFNIHIWASGSAILSAKQGKSGFIYNLIKS